MRGADELELEERDNELMMTRLLPKAAGVAEIWI
jgi:hypothetical protein